MSVEVLLIADVKDLGVEGDIVKVADGHARNYLFPQNLGAPVTEATKRKLAKMQGERENKKKLDLLGASEKRWISTATDWSSSPQRAWDIR